MSVLLNEVSIKPLRELRMWHWYKVTSNRAQERNHEARATAYRASNGDPNIANALAKREDRKAAFYKKTADFHIKAVQALNDVVPGTAEGDCIADDAQRYLLAINPLRDPRSAVA